MAIQRRVVPLIALGLLLAAMAIAAAAPSRGAPIPSGGPAPMIARVVHSHLVSPPTIQQCLAAFGIRCYQPREILDAYNLNELHEAGLNGRGRTIVIVDSFGSPTIGADLAVFDAQFHLPAPPSFTVLQPSGPVPPFDPTNSAMVGWAYETTLDVEWAHTVAPGANIVLVETPVAETEGVVGFPQIVHAENWVIDHGIGDVISQSFGATEQTFSEPEKLLALRSAYQDAREHGVTVLASTGDYGAASQRFNGSFFPFPTVGWPASDPLVTGVGGTYLDLNSEGDRLQPDVTANDGPAGVVSAGGLSVVFDRPGFQNSVRSVTGDDRGLPDIAMSGACLGAVLIYDTFTGTPSYDPICGTSESSPLFSGIVAIADQVAGKRLGWINPALYQMSNDGDSGIVDVVKGNNTDTVCTANCTTPTPTMTTVHGFNALPGYDLTTGVGTVDAPAFVRELAETAG